MNASPDPSGIWIEVALIFMVLLLPLPISLPLRLGIISFLMLSGNSLHD